jgi:hypothetical protein
VQPVTASIQRVRVPSWELFDWPGSDIRRVRGATPGRESPEVKVPAARSCGAGAGWRAGQASLGAAALSERCSVVKKTHQEPPSGGAQCRLWDYGSAEPVAKGRRPVPAGKESNVCTRGALRRRGGGTKARIGGSKRGRSGVQPRPGRMAKTQRITAETGSRREGSRLAAEAVVAVTARTTQPRLSKGPLGERGRCLQERLGVVPLAAITRRGAVPAWLRASWSRPVAAAKAAGQPANCRRHEGWSRSPSPRTRRGTRSLRCARFQPDWGKPNIRLIGGREETGASRLVRAAHGASRLPDPHPPIPMSSFATVLDPSFA